MNRVKVITFCFLYFVFYQQILAQMPPDFAWLDRMTIGGNIKDLAAENFTFSEKNPKYASYETATGTTSEVNVYYIEKYPEKWMGLTVDTKTRGALITDNDGYILAINIKLKKPSALIEIMEKKYGKAENNKWVKDGYQLTVTDWGEHYIATIQYPEKK